jgi:prepilin-type N-terminal cleavage/methylation domain-containing protein
MKSLPHSTQGFTLVEALVASTIMSLVLAAVTAGVISLQRSFAASQDFISSHLEQVRALDTMQRDARAATGAEVRNNGTTVVLTIPTGDPGLLNLQLPTTMLGLFTTSGGGTPAPTTKTVAYTFANQRLTRTENNQVQTVATRQTKFLFQQNGSQIATTLAFPSRYSNPHKEVPASTQTGTLAARASAW